MIEDIADETIGAFERGEAILIRRGQNGQVQTNVPHVCVEHSPSGYEFGFGGSGPADLALNICERILTLEGHRGRRMKCDYGTCFEASWRAYMDVKWKCIAGIDRLSGATLDYGEVLEVIRQANETAGETTVKRRRIRPKMKDIA